MKQETKKFVIDVIKYVLLFSLLPLLLISNIYIVDTVYFTIVIIVSAVCICFFLGDEIYFFNKKEYIMAAILSFIFIVMLSFFEVIHSSLFNYKALCNTYSNVTSRLILAWGYAVYLPSLIISTFILMCGLIYFFIQKQSAFDKPSVFEKCSKRHCCIIIAIMSALFLFSTYPGIFVINDVAGLWASVCNGEWSNWHTLGYELFVAFCALFYKSTFAVNVCQTIIWIVINCYILNILEDFNKKSMRCYTFVLVIAVTPFLYLENTLKDVVFSSGMLALTAGIWNIIRNQKIRRMDYIMTAFIALFVTLCRHAGWIAPVFGFSALFIHFVVHKNRSEAVKIIEISACHIFSYMFVYLILFNLLGVPKIPAYISYGTPMSMIGAAVQEGVSFDEDDTKLLERVMPLSEWGECYNKYWADEISRPGGKIGDRVNVAEELLQNEGFGKDLIRINAKLFINHPIIYCRALFDMNSIIWEIGRPSDEEGMTPVTTLCKVEKNEQISYLTCFKITDLLTNFYDDMPILHPLFLRGGVSVFTLLFSVVIFCLKKSKRYILTLLPIIMYGCTLSITIPAQDTRYILPMMECAIFVLAVVYGLKNCNLPVKNSESSH